MSTLRTFQINVPVGQKVIKDPEKEDILKWNIFKIFLSRGIFSQVKAWPDIQYFVQDLRLINNDHSKQTHTHTQTNKQWLFKWRKNGGCGWILICKCRKIPAITPAIPDALSFRFCRLYDSPPLHLFYCFWSNCFKPASLSSSSWLLTFWDFLPVFKGDTFVTNRLGCRWRLFRLDISIQTQYTLYWSGENINPLLYIYINFSLPFLCFQWCHVFFYNPQKLLPVQCPTCTYKDLHVSFSAWISSLPNVTLVLPYIGTSFSLALTL